MVTAIFTSQVTFHTAYHYGYINLYKTFRELALGKAFR